MSLGRYLMCLWALQFLCFYSVGASAFAAQAAGPCNENGPDSAVRAFDLFKRPIGSVPLSLPDWDGYMANPAIKFEISPGDGNVTWPLIVTLTTDDPVVHFDLPSRVDETGASKTLVFRDAALQEVYVTAFPKRIKQSYARTILIRTSSQKSCVIALTVTPVVSGNRTPWFPITVDFSQDKTGFYGDPAHREIFHQAVSDWAYYLKDEGAPLVPALEERTLIFEPSGFKSARFVLNNNAYRGFLLYGYGISTPELRSGGEPSSFNGRAGAQNTGPPARPRSGGVETEVLGNFNKLGWVTEHLDDKDWWKATNLRSVRNDLYSILHHEIGHALFFNPGHPGFVRNGTLKIWTSINSQELRLNTNASDHFEGVIDPVSLRGAYGNEFHGRMPLGRWLLTRTDLFALRAVGYALRDVAPILPLTLVHASLPPATANHEYAGQLGGYGGVPVYDWTILSGTLPPGLRLDRYSGKLLGRPTKSGEFKFRVRLQDYSVPGSTVEGDFSLLVR